MKPSKQPPRFAPRIALPGSVWRAVRGLTLLFALLFGPGVVFYIIGRLAPVVIIAVTVIVVRALVLGRR